MTKNNKILLACGVVLAATLVVIGVKKYRKNKEQEDKSNFVEDMLDNFGKASLTQFAFKNNSSNAVQIRLFDTYGGGNYSSLSNTNLPYFNQTLPREPKKVKTIKVIANGVNAVSQTNQMFVKTCKDASGNSATEEYIPMMSTMQFQSKMTEIRPNNLILDGTCFLDYVIQPKTTVTIIIDYDRVSVSGNLSKSKK
jgi:hypothetical protein